MMTRNDVFSTREEREREKITVVQLRFKRKVQILTVYECHKHVIATDHFGLEQKQIVFNVKINTHKHSQIPLLTFIPAFFENIFEEISSPGLKEKFTE